MVLLSLFLQRGKWDRCLIKLYKFTEHTNDRRKHTKPLVLPFQVGISDLADLREVLTVPEALSCNHLPPYGVPHWLLITIAINTDPRGQFPYCSQSMQLRIFLYLGEFDLKVFNVPILPQLLGEMQARQLSMRFQQDIQFMHPSN